MNSISKIGSFFDLDGTLLALPSLESRFLTWLFMHDEIRGANLGHWLRNCVKLVSRDPQAAFEGNKFYLSGLRSSLVADWAAAGAPLSPPIFSEGLAQLARHHAQGHRVFLITGTLAPLARAMAQLFPCPVEICASEPLEFNGRWTGQLSGNHMSRQTKARALRVLAAKCGLDLRQSFAYGNDTLDFPMLQSVGTPVAVNPSWRLARMARLRGWKICKWHESQPARPVAATNLLAPKGAQ